MAGAARTRPAIAIAATASAALLVARARRQRPRPTPPGPDVVGGDTWTPGPAVYGLGIRRNVEVRMSDSTVLRVNVHHPTLPSTGEPAPGPFPVLLMMTPYGKQAPGGARAVQATGADPYLVERGYIEVIADVRGTGTSGGAFELFGHAQVRDGVELVNWAARLPESTGAVGMFGISYMGNNQLLTAAAVGPDSPLKAIFPIHAANDVYRGLVTMGGIPHLPFLRSYKATFAALNIINPLIEAVTAGLQNRPRPTRLARVRAQGRVQSRYFTELINDSLRDGDPAYDGELWERLRPAAVLDKVVANGIPAFIVGGWSDCYQRGAPLNYAGLQNAWAGRQVDAPMSPDQQVTGRYQLLMGSWYHMTSFPGADLSRLQLRWFDHWLKGADTGIADIRPLHLNEKDTHNWLKATTYPLAEATPTRLYLDNGALTRTPPKTPSTNALHYTPRGLPSGRSWEQWSLGAVSFALGQAGRRIPYDRDNRRMQRNGVLTYTSDPLPTPVLIAGPVGVTLVATSTTTESLWVVHLDDVAPDGTSRPLTQGALLGSRRSLDTTRTWYTPSGGVLLPYHPHRRDSTKPITPGETTRYDIEVYPTFARLAASHRIRITIATSDFPHLVPLPKTRPTLRGGIYQLHLGAEGSHVEIPLATPDSFTEE